MSDKAEEVEVRDLARSLRKTLVAVSALSVLQKRRAIDLDLIGGGVERLLLAADELRGQVGLLDEPARKGLLDALETMISPHGVKWGTFTSSAEILKRALERAISETKTRDVADQSAASAGERG